MERRTCSDANVTAGGEGGVCHRLLAVPQLISAKFGLDSICFFFLFCLLIEYFPALLLVIAH